MRLLFYCTFWRNIPNTAFSLFSFADLKGALSGLRQFLTTKSPLKMKKKAFNFTSKALFVLKMFKFLSWLFSHVAKRLHQKDKVNFEIYDVTAWLSNNCKTYIAQYLRRKGNQTMKFARLIEYNMTNIFLEKSYTKCSGESSPRPFFEKLKLSISLDQ